MAKIDFLKKVSRNWGPQDRTTFTIEQPSGYNSFNSITNNPNHGDERNFVSVKFLGQDASSWKKALNVNAGDRLTIRVYIHNNAAGNSGQIAEKVNVKTFLQREVSGNRLFVEIDSHNSTPQIVWDSVFLSKNSEFTVDLVENSVRLFNNFRPSDGFNLSDSIVSDLGAWIGYDKIDGKIPGCFQYTSILIFDIIINND